MPATIRIKRSGNTVSPTTLASGEIAYSWESSTAGKLYIGWGDEIVAGQAPNIAVIGGKYFTDLVSARISHTPGTLTANSAIITDSANKIDLLNVDNITINGNTISSTNTNGNIILDPNGIGTVDVSSTRITSVATPTANTDAVNKQYVDEAINTLSSNSNLDIAGDTGTGSIVLESEIFIISGGTGLSSAVTDNTVTINLDNTAVVANTYGNASSVGTFTVDAQGRLTAATTTLISIVSTQVSDFTEAVQDVVGTFTSANTEQGIIVTYTDSANSLVISAFDANTTQKGVASFDSTDFTVTSGNVTLNVERIQDVVSSVLVEGEGIDIVYDDTANTITISGEDATLTNKGIASFGGWADNGNTVRQFSVTTGDVKVVALDGGSF